MYKVLDRAGVDLYRLMPRETHAHSSPPNTQSPRVARLHHPAERPCILHRLIHRIVGGRGGGAAEQSFFEGGGV